MIKQSSEAKQKLPTESLTTDTPHFHSGNVDHGRYEKESYQYITKISQENVSFINKLPLRINIMIGPLFQSNERSKFQA